MKIIEIILTEFEKLNMHILNCGAVEMGLIFLVQLLISWVP